MRNSVFAQYSRCREHLHWLPKEFIVFIQRCPDSWIRLAEHILDILNGIAGMPYIGRVKRLPAVVLDIFRNAVGYKADRVQSAFLVNPAAIFRFTDVIIMPVQKPLQNVVSHLLLTPHKNIRLLCQR